MMKRTPLIAANWKMHKTGPEAVEAAEKLEELCKDIHDVDVMIAPSFLSLPLVSQALKASDSRIHIAAQNLYFEDQGAFTGEISGPMIQAAGAEYVLIGHSERRQFFGDTDNIVNRKIHAAIRSHLTPILCVGETEIQRDEEKTFFVLDNQISDGVKGVNSKMPEELILAYEPVWAIGTGKSANTEQIAQVHRFLRSLLEKHFSREFAQKTRILYGGSVKPDNINALMDMEDVDGVLVGGASRPSHSIGQDYHRGSHCVYDYFPVPGLCIRSQK